MNLFKPAGAGFFALTTFALGLALSAPAAMAQDDTSTAPRPGYGMMKGWGQGTGQGMGPGMTGQGMMGQGMMGQGMMGPGMMGRGYGMGGCGMMGYGASGNYDTYLDGRIAFLKAELKITDDQEEAWSAYADAMRTNSQSMVSMRGTMMQMFRNSGQDRSAIDMLDFRIEAMKARLETLQELKPATEDLYNALSDEQKKKADEILPVMGCM